MTELLAPDDALGRKNRRLQGDMSPCWNTSSSDKAHSNDVDRLTAAALIQASKEEYRPQTQQRIGTRYVNLTDRAERMRSNRRSDDLSSSSGRGMGRSSHVFAIVRGARSEAERFLAMRKEQKVRQVLVVVNLCGAGS